MRTWMTNSCAMALAACMSLRAADAPPPPAAPPPAPAKPVVAFFSLYHKSPEQALRYLEEFHPDLVKNGAVKDLKSAERTLALTGDAAAVKDMGDLLSEFDRTGLKLAAQLIKLKHMAPNVALELMGIAGICQVWMRVSEDHTKSWVVGKDTHSLKSVAPAYTKWVPAQAQKEKGEDLPFYGLPEVPYVVEMPTFDPFIPPAFNMDKASTERTLVQFPNPSSTEERNCIMVVGTQDDYERIRAFLDTIDRPARMVMLEVQIVELNASKMRDLGIDASQFAIRHSILNFNTTFSGEPIPSPRFPDSLLRGPEYASIPDATREGFSYLFDDSSVDIPGQFAAAIRALERKGDAKVRARPKILAVDDRVNVLHIGKELVTFDGTAVTQDTNQGNLVSTINRVSRQYTGITLNLRPRVVGEDGQEVVLQMDIALNDFDGERRRVFAEDLLGVPEISVRRFTGQARVKNHTPIILGGLISESEVESSNRVPILGDIPIIGRLFGRDYSETGRTEVIMMITPHVLVENDPTAMPRESKLFDTEDSVLFNDRYILRGKDLIGVDLGTLEPVNNGKERFTREEVVDLSLLHIVKQRNLVQKLEVLAEYMPDKASQLSWWQRRWPDKTVQNWSSDDQQIYYEAAAHVIETIKNLNRELSYTELVKPRREIILPTSPHRVSLTYNDLKTYYERGTIALRGEDELDAELKEDIKRASTHTFHQFARYIERVGVPAEAHGELRTELLKLHTKLFPEEGDLKTLEYHDLFRELGDRGIDFMALYTYFTENEARYKDRGNPRLGQLKTDLKTFLRMSVSTSEKAKELKELDERWQGLNVGDEGQRS